jgi:hypothetical protein
VQALPISCILLAAEIGRFFTEDPKLLFHYHQSSNQSINQSNNQATYRSYFLLCEKDLCKIALVDD